MNGLLDARRGSNRRLAVVRCEPWGAQLLVDAGIRLFDAQEPLEQARMIKTADEIKCLQLSGDVCDIGVDRTGQARLLTSSERTNPWFQERSNRVLEAGDTVSFDADMVGPFGYLAATSRSLVGPGRKPTPEQRRLYEVAQEQVLTNVQLTKPGLSFRGFAERCWPVSAAYVPHRYMFMVHGAGFVDEYPTVVYTTDWKDWGYDAVFKENMVVCVESFIREIGAKEGVKLEEQVLVTANGAVAMSRSPLVDALEP